MIQSPGLDIATPSARSYCFRLVLRDMDQYIQFHSRLKKNVICDGVYKSMTWDKPVALAIAPIRTGGIAINMHPKAAT